MNVCQIRRVSHYTQDMRIIDLLLDENDTKIEKVIYILRRIREKRNIEEQFRLVEYFLTVDGIFVDDLLKLICNEYILNFNFEQQTKILNYYKNNINSQKIFLLINMIVRYFSFDDTFIILQNYETNNNNQTFRILTDENILKNRSCKEIISLIDFIKQKGYDENICSLVRSEILLRYYTCDDQIELINKNLKKGEECRNNIFLDITNYLGINEEIIQKFNEKQVNELIKLYLKHQNLGILDIINNKDVLDCREFSDLIKLINIYIFYPIECVIHLITKNTILKKLNIKEHLNLIKLYIQNNDIYGLFDEVISTFDIQNLTVNESFEKINKYILKYRGIYVVKEVTKKFATVDEFIECLQSDNIGIVNSNTKIYCMMRQKDNNSEQKD